MKFDLPKENASIIKVIGVGGGGSNAVNHMFNEGIAGVDFIICNTDQQALDMSQVPIKIQLGATLTEGRGAGSIPEVGKNCALENLEEVRNILASGTKMVFITAGMGGGTGTGAAPVIAKAAREMGILTVGIVTMPFFFEGKKRKTQAETGIEELREQVDTLVIVNNEKLREMYGNLPVKQAFTMADDVLTTAAKGISEIITRTGYINVDFEDVRTVMRGSGVAIMGSASAEGPDRAIAAAERALTSPLLNDNNIEGAQYVLLNITFGNESILMDEVSSITDFIQNEAGSTADVIWGYGMDETLGDKINVTIIATGFKQNPHLGLNSERTVEQRRIGLNEQPAKPTPAPPQQVTSPYVKPAEPQPVAFVKAEPAPASTAPVQTEPPASQRVIEFDLNKPTPSPAITQEPVAAVPTPPVETNKSEPAINEDNEWKPYLKNTSEPAAPVRMAEEAPAPTASNRTSEAAPRTNDPMNRLREMSRKLRSAAGIAELENEPAYKRRSVSFDDVPNSAESTTGKYSLNGPDNVDEDGRTKIRPNSNPYLSNAVD